MISYNFQGFTDRQTWVKNFYHEDSPLIFDEDYRRKPCYYGLRDAISTMVVGGTVGGGLNLKEDVDIDGRPWGSNWMPFNKKEKEDHIQNTEIEDMAGDSRPDWLRS